MSHDAWIGAYSAFSRWRNTLAEVAGYKIIKITDDGQRLPREHQFTPADPRLGYESVDIPWDLYEEKNYQGEWDDTPEDPLLLLIVHSDCDGRLTPRHAGLVADRLEELLPKLPEGEVGGHIGDYRVKTQAFIDGLRLAAKNGEDVEFE